MSNAYYQWAPLSRGHGEVHTLAVASQDLDPRRGDDETSARKRAVSGQRRMSTSRVWPIGMRQSEGIEWAAHPRSVERPSTVRTALKRMSSHCTWAATLGSGDTEPAPGQEVAHQQ